MIVYEDSIKAKARRLRMQGHSLGEISKKLKIARSTASLWSKDSKLNQTALKILENKKISARLKGLVTIKKHRALKYKSIGECAITTVSKLDLANINLCKTLCAFLYWGEGNKTGSRLALVNSDPQMIFTFLNLLRKSFPLDESKFRALVHIHEYHDESEIKGYWSTITGIPISKFTKSYLKPHTSKIIRQGYKGAIRISYHDSKIAAELKATYNVLSKHLGL